MPPGGGSPPPGGGMPPGGDQGGGGEAKPTRTAWKNLSSRAGGMRPGGKDNFSGVKVDRDPPSPKEKKGSHDRTEFVILFIWQEPTPSDALRGEDGGATPGGASPAANPGGSKLPGPPR